MNEEDIIVYEPHAGTVKIAGQTICKKAAGCALRFLVNGVENIDFFYIGANAGQQAMKSMGIFRYILERLTDHKLTVVYQPERVRTLVQDNYLDAVVWKAVVVSKEALAQHLPQIPKIEEDKLRDL